MLSEADKAHGWLHQLPGEWTSEGEATMEAGRPPERVTGVERGDDGTRRRFMTATYRRTR